MKDVAQNCVENRLREVRVLAGVTQEELARALGVTRQTIIAIEKGRYLPSLTLALKIASYFNKKVEDIFHLKQECKPQT